MRFKPVDGIWGKRSAALAGEIERRVGGLRPTAVYAFSRATSQCLMQSAWQYRAAL